MRICYVASPSIHTDRWVRYFADNGHDVHLITSVSRYEGDIGNATVHYLRRFGPQARAISYPTNLLPLIVQFRRLVKHINPDVIHAQSVMDITGLAAASGFHPFVVTVWGSDILIEPQKSRLSKWLVDYVLKRTDLVTCDAEHMQRALAQMGVPPEKIKVLYFGTDTEKFHPRNRDEKLRKNLGIKDTPVVFSLRNLEPVYDIGSLVRSAPAVLKEVPQVKFLIAGSGSQEAELKDMADSLGVSQNVVFLGRLTQADLPRYLASADVYVSTSLSDAGLAASTAEAMACEVPVIITDFGDNRKWVEDGESGLITPLKNPDALASKIVFLLKNKEIRLKFGQAARRIIEEKNSTTRQMGKMAVLYQQLVKEHARKGKS